MVDRNPRRGQGLVEAHGNRHGPAPHREPEVIGLAAERMKASTADSSAVDALCHSGRDGSAQPKQLTGEDQVRVGDNVRVGLE
jgi:hypothetical protein